MKEKIKHRIDALTDNEKIDVMIYLVHWIESFGKCVTPDSDCDDKYIDDSNSYLFGTFCDECIIDYAIEQSKKASQ